MSRHRGSKDKNHDLICDTFRMLGCTVADMATCGVDGFPDIVVGLLGWDVQVEIKNPDTAYGRAGLTEAQARYARDWAGRRPVMVRTVDEAVALVQNWRRN